MQDKQILSKIKDENTYIMNLEACYLYKDIMSDKPLTAKNRDLKKLFSATIPYSLETMRIDGLFPNNFYTVNKKQYTECIINVTFDQNYTQWVEVEVDGEVVSKKNTIANKSKIRKYMCENGFVLDGCKYVFYKRGAGKAKNGYAFYIKEELRDKLILRSRLGLVFEEDEELDLTSLLAYESLISSGLDFTINLDPKTEILLIDDIYGEVFESLASVTSEIDKNIITKNEIVTLQNCLTDGQGLLDESVFEACGKKDKGFMLLRSDLFKDCAFNTKLQKWFKFNNIETLVDMFGNIYDASKIKLIITPNSLKFLKFAYKIGDGSKSGCYEYWKNNIDNIFGVVKCDKAGNYGNYNRITYQLLNSIPNLTYDELMELTFMEREYVMLLKNDEAVFRNYLGGDAIASLRLERNLTKEDNKDALSMLENTELLSSLLLVNSDIQYTKKFKEMKKDLIRNYIGHLKEGKIRLKDTKYATLISNPYEMLLATIGEYDNKSIMNDREVYCQYYNNHQEFCISRNPHINGGNVMHGENVEHDEYQWFNFTDNIVAVNFFDNDMPDRLQGCDTDSDTFIMIPHPILVEKAKYCECKFPTPLNRVKGSSLPKKNNMKELQKLDTMLSNNYIGRIVNMSQIINSYLNDAIHKNESEEIINELYEATSKLSSMSQIEIDKSKKIFENISMSKELAKMRQIPYIRFVNDKDRFGEMCKKMIVPNFFNMISDANDYRVFDKFNTPLDILQDVLEFDHSTYRRGDKHKEMKDLLVVSKELDGRYQVNSAIAIFSIIEVCGKKINGLKLKSNTLKDKAKKTVEKKYKLDAINKLKTLTPNDSTILGILKQSFGSKEDDKLGFKKYAVLTLNLLFVCNKLQVLKCFKNNNMDLDDVLIKINDKYDFDIFGEKYQKISRKDLKI